MVHFTTLFNINYLAKGVALHASLMETCANFQLYVFAFDEATYTILTNKNLANVTVIPSKDFETEELLNIKKERSIAEYCWTCTPLTIRYCLDKFALAHCTYLDADLYFYKDPSILISEMGDNSVLITPHNYYKEYDQSAISGIYCVQFLTFKNDLQGNKLLDWWVQACLNWCYAQYEDGKFGDQKYLDSWPYMFDGVFICKNVHAGVAPWNAINYPSQKDIDSIIFYHFHDLQYFSDNTWYTGTYQIPQLVLDQIYRPYIKVLRSLKKEVSDSDCLNTKDKKSFGTLTFKYKVGIYILDAKSAFRVLFNALFFIKRRKFYKNNFIK